MAEYYHIAVVPCQRSQSDEQMLRESAYVVRLSSDGSLDASLPTDHALTSEELAGKLSHYSIAFCKKVIQGGQSSLQSPTTRQAFVENLETTQFTIEQNHRLGKVNLKQLTFLDKNILAVLSAFFNPETRRRLNLENQFEFHDYQKTVNRNGGYDAIRGNSVRAVCINASNISPEPERAFVLSNSQKTKDTDIMMDEVLEGYDNTLLINAQGAHITRLTHRPVATQWNAEAATNAPAPTEVPEPDVPVAPAVTAEEVAEGIPLKDKVKYALIGLMVLVALPILVILSPFILIAYLAYNKTHGAPNR